MDPISDLEQLLEELHELSKHSKKYPDALKNLLTQLSTLDSAKLSVFDQVFSNFVYLPEFDFFLFSHLCRSFKRQQKTAEITQNFLSILFKFGVKHINPRIFEDINDAKKSKAVDIMCTALDLLPLETIKNEALKTNDNRRIYLILGWLELRKNSEGMRIFEEFVQTRIKDEYFIDVNSRKPNGFKFFRPMRLLITQESFENFYLPNMLKLIKRSENNLDLMRIVLAAEIPIDMSKSAEEILIGNLKEYFFTKNSEICIAIAKKVVVGTKDFETLIKVLKKLETLVNTTNNEQNKMIILHIFEGFILSLPAFEQSQQRSLQKEILQIFLNNFTMISLEELVPSMKKLIECFISKSSEFQLESKEINSLKTIITAQKNKFALLSTLSFLLAYLKRYSLAKPESSFSELAPLCDAINTQILTTNLKNPQKLVTGFQTFLQALEIVFFSYPFKDLSKNVKFENLISFFSESILTHQAKFLQKSGPQELTAILNITISATRYFREENEEFFEESNWKILCANSFVQCLLEKSLSPNTIKDTFKQLEQNLKPRIHNLLISGLFYRIFFNEVVETKDSEKIRWLCKYIVKNLDSILFNETQIFQFLFLIYHEEVSSEKLLSHFLKATSKNKELFEKFVGFFKDKGQEILGVLFSSTGVFSRKKSNVRGCLSFFRAFIDFKNEDFLNIFMVFLDDNNFFDGENIEKFEETMNGLKEGNIFLSSIESAGSFLVSTGFMEAKVHILYEEYANPVQPPKEKAGAGAKKGPGKNQEKKGGKKGAGKPEVAAKKVELLDEEEIAKLLLEQLYKKIWNYYEKLVLIFKVFSGRIQGNHDALNLYYSKLYPGLVAITAGRKEFRGGFLDILHVFYNSDPKLCKYRLVIGDLLIKKLDYEGPDESHHDNLIKLLTFLPTYVNEEENRESLEFWEELMCFLLQNKEFDLKTKNLALNFLFSLAKMKSLEEKIESIYDEIIGNINALANFEELLLKVLNYLLPKMSPKTIRNMFDNILDVSDRAQETCLKCLAFLLSGPPEATASIKSEIGFEIFIKIRIMQLSSVSEISVLCAKLLQIINYQETQEEISGFEIVEFLRKNSKESLDDFCQILTEIIKNKPSIAEALLHTLFLGTKGLLEIEKGDDDKFLYLPQFIKINLNRIPEHFLEEIFSILIGYLCRESNKILTEEALEIGKELIRFHGPKCFEKISAFLNAQLNKKSLDKGQQICTVVFIGVLSPFITNSAQSKEITNKVLELLESSDDNQNQQVNLSRCLSDMIILFPDAETKIEEHLTTIFNEKNKKKQLFSAYLISGFIRGLGIAIIDQLKIFEKIESFMEGIFKKELYLKEGILRLLEALYENNGKLLEPYLPRFLNLLIQFFGDHNEEIRTTSLMICRTAISKLSSFGVKNVLPLLLKGIDEKSMNWKVKLANISALANLAYCSPKQLSLSLPQIIPKLTATLSDTHPKIREGADEALKVIGKTIKNPEVSANVDILIKAINNPFDENKKGLEVLLKTQFVHYIDIPALSLIIPILDYGLRSRESALKENASQIVGTISHLIKDPKDLLPYLDILVNALRVSVCDAIVSVRNITAKAFGALAKKLGEFNSTKLLRTLRSILDNPDSKSNEKAGAAQAYSEVICAIGVDYFERQKDDIISRILDTKQHIKESYIGLFVYLPGIMEDAFEPYLSLTLDNLVESLSDENENIRGLTLRVVKIFIDKFGMKNTQLLLTPINDGLFNINMRKRNSSINLTGDLLKVLSKSRNQGSENYMIAIYEETLASVYILKHDEYEVIKNTADNVWKENVTNTPKVLKQILPLLVKKFIELLTLETGIEKLAHNTIKEYCGKYSDSIFYEFIDILEKRTKLEEPSFRGIFLTLNQFIKETQTSTIYKNSKGITNLLHAQMTSREELIRKSVYQTYNSYLEKFPDAKPLAETMDPILEEIETLDESNSLYEDYLKVFDEFIELNNQKILNYMLAILFERPLKAYRIEVITNNAGILGNELYSNHRIDDIIQRIFDEIFGSLDNPSRLSSLLYCLNQLSINIANENIMHFINDCLALIKKYRDKNFEKLIIVLDILKFFFQNTLANFGKNVPEFLYNFISFLFVEKPEMANIINALLKALLKTQEKEQCAIFLIEFYNKLSSAVSNRKDQSSIYAMNQEGGLDPYINILINTLVYGWQNDCEYALKFYLLIFSSVRVELIAPHTLRLMGPLIRVANYNYEIGFKKNIIEVLGKMHQLKLPIKPFESQLQLTYFRLIKDAGNESDVLNLLVFNFLDLLLNSNRKDFIMNELFSRFKETVPDETGKNGYLLIISKALSKNIECFSKALLENLFHHLMNIGLLEINSIETLYYMGKVLGLMGTFTKKSLVKEAIIRESNALLEESKENFENNENLIENYKTVCSLMGIFCNGRLEFDEETMKIIEKVSEDVYNSLNIFSSDQCDFCLRFFKKMAKINNKLKSSFLRRSLVEKLKKEVKEKFKNIELV